MLSIQDKTTIAAAIALPITASLIALTVPGSVAPTTALAFAALVLGSAAIGVNLWNNADARGSMAQLIHETNTAATVAPTSGATRDSRWEVWEKRGEALARTGTIRAFLGVSVAMTAAILYVWIA